jgi:AraC family transcriptional regulator, dual regulator of chb operon
MLWFDMRKSPRMLCFDTRRAQGEYFHLASVEWARNVLLPNHTHDYPEIFWLTQGQCEHRVNGQSRLLSAGALVLMRPADVHGLYAMRDKRFAFTNLAIQPEFWRDTLERFPDPLDRLYDFDAPLPWMNQLRQHDLDTLTEDVRRLASQPHTPFYLERFLMNVWMMCVASRGSDYHAGDAPDWLAEAIICIQEGEILSGGVQAFVKLCGRSHEHVCRACRKHCGKSPSTLVNEARLAYAARALRTTARSVLEISQDCGFEAPGHFYALFRKAYGTTPLKYRQPH